ncbi:MinD/ParA family protein [Candidatus Frankia alpina]|uniref:CobQ/CobB/MinD/ParA nucleotide binding domain-containing protein n=1 Tax=Candidatus Frankia alpina TaxID=2699483 RepID=A0A4S5ET20_9ACTN|nr:hypothetical protein [Candidatus Frankia alpina]THJ75618.1 hypothetical protein E7Y31_04440 [Candidatus Frankia alpina]
MTVLVPAAGSILPLGAPPASAEHPAEDVEGSAIEPPGHPWPGASHPTGVDPASAVGPAAIESSRAALLPYPEVTPASPYPAAAPARPELPALPFPANPGAPWQAPEAARPAPGVADTPRPVDTARPAAAEPTPLHWGEASRFDGNRPGGALTPAEIHQTPEPTWTGDVPRSGGVPWAGDGARAVAGQGGDGDPTTGDRRQAGEAFTVLGPWAEPISTAPALPPPPPNMPVRRVPAAPVRTAGSFVASRAAEIAQQPAPAPVASTAPVGADGLAHQRPRTGGRRVLVGGFGGGGGRTTVAAGVGLAMAAHHGHRVVAVDASPDQCGLLAHRVGLMPPGVGLRELASAVPPISSLEDVRRFLASDGSGGLEVLAGMRDLAGPGLLPEELAWALDLLGHWYPVVVADAPPGWNQPVPATLLARADLLVLTVRAGEAEIASADDALTALTAAGRGDLAATVIVAIVETYPSRLSRSARMRLDHLEDRAYMTVPVPFDSGLADSRPINWFRLRRRTRFAFQRLAGAIATAPLPGSHPAAVLARPALAAPAVDARGAAWSPGS